MAHVTTDVSQVVAPALRFTAVLLKLPATPYHQKKLEERFASHWPMSSLFGSSGFFVVYETNLATEIDHVKPISPSIIENRAILIISNIPSCWKLYSKKWREKCGSSGGINPTISPLKFSWYHNKYENNILNDNKNNTFGIFGIYFQMIIRKIMDPIPQMRVGIWDEVTILDQRL